MHTDRYLSAWHWQNAPAAVAMVTQVGMYGGPLPVCAFEPGPRGLSYWIPRAMNVRDTVVQQLTEKVLSNNYHCQEKLNGVFVLWDGAHLWSKSGNPVDSDGARRFTQFLPPGFPLVGEMYLAQLCVWGSIYFFVVSSCRTHTHTQLPPGYGPHERSIASTLVKNELPSLQTLPPGTRKESRDVMWSHARLVAFDVPGLISGTDNQQWTYGARYELLRHVVGAWSRKVTGDPENDRIAHTSYPLQLIRQYDMIYLPDMFREVVHGVPWEQRKFPGFGIPRTKKVDDPSNKGKYVWRAYEAFHWLPEDGDAVTLFPPNVRASGEGLMLWRQDAPWQMAGRRTQAILKYKPTVLTVGVVFASPEHTHHKDMKANDEEGRLPGYQVRLRWWDNVKGHWTYVVPYISAAFDPARVMTMYPLDQPVFFTFLMYESKPLYPRAIGRSLPHRDAVAVQEAAAALAGQVLVGGSVSDTLDGVPSLELLRNPNLWNSGEMRALFPSQVPWSPIMFVLGARAMRRIQPGIVGVTARVPSASFVMSFQTLQRALLETKKSAHEAVVQARMATTEKLVPECTHWLNHNVQPNKPHHTLVYLLFVVARWSQTTNSGVDWWADIPHQCHAMRHMLTEWGPFKCIAPERNALPLLYWNYAMLRAGVTILASVWLRLGDIEFHRLPSAISVTHITEGTCASCETVAHCFSMPWWTA
jgi:hypothetical protein